MASSSTTGFQFQSNCTIKPLIKINNNTNVFNNNNDTNNLKSSAINDDLIRIALSKLSSEVNELKSQNHLILTKVVPELIKNLIDNSIEKIIEERRLSDAYNLEESIGEQKTNCKHEIIKLITLKGDIILNDKNIEKHFASVLRIR